MRAKGEVDEFAAVYDRHRSHVYAQCMRRLRSAADADDATQVTFLRAWSAIQRGSGPRLGAGPWLSTIARNVCSDRLCDPRQAVPVDTDEMVIVDDGPAPDEGVLAESDGIEVRAALAHLPFAQRSALHLREVDELTYAEIGERLALPVSAVETLLFRARGNLRDELEAVRDPVGCERAHTLATMVRDGLSVAAGERKRLRNHRADCKRCAWLPVRRARGLTGARAAAAVVATASAVALRRLIVTPVAEAMASAGAPAKTAAVVLTAGSAAAGGVAIERPAVEHHASKPPAVTREAAAAPARSRPVSTPVQPSVARRTVPAATAAATPTRRTVTAESRRQTATTRTRGSDAPERDGEPGGDRQFERQDREQGSGAPTSMRPRQEQSGWQGDRQAPQQGREHQPRQQQARESGMPWRQESAEQTRPDRGTDGPGARW